MHTEFRTISIVCLQPGQFQPRQDFADEPLRELSASIASQGLIEPIIVRPITKECYEIVAGERRWRASKMAGLTEVPCLIGHYTDKQACALTLIENIQRQNLNLIEEASGYKRLMDEFHYQQDEIATLVGKSRSHVANILRLLTLSDPVRQLIRSQVLSLGHARMLVGLAVGEQETLAQQAAQEGWSVRHMEQVVKQLKSNELLVPQNPKKDKDIERLETLLSEQVGAPVQIIDDVGDGGWLKVKFFNNDTLAGLLERLGLRYD